MRSCNTFPFFHASQCPPQLFILGEELVLWECWITFHVYMYYVIYPCVYPYIFYSHAFINNIIIHVWWRLCFPFVYFFIFSKYRDCFPCLYKSPLPETVQQCNISINPENSFLFFILAILMVWGASPNGFHLHFLIGYFLFPCSLAFVISSLKQWLGLFFAQFLIGLSVFPSWSCMSSLLILDISPLWHIGFKSSLQ